MSNGEENKPTELYNPHAPRRQQADWAPPGAGQSALKTEVLRPKGPKIMAMLVVVDGPGTGQIFRLNPLEPMTLGREYTCDFVIDDSAISRQHARVRFEQSEKGELQFFIQDLATENGTQVNGQHVIKHYLQDGDRVLIGRSTLVYKQID